MDSIGVPISQFADNCGIPRPSMSQLLNGRNKRISDDVINKIHSAYPSLSILWLMFGEGDMETDANIKISEPQKDEISVDTQAQSNDIEQVGFEESPRLDFSEVSSDNSFSDISLFDTPEVSTPTPPAPSPVPVKENINFGVRDENTQDKKVSITPDAHKKITNIVVFYSDNSFQSFMPEA